MVWCGLMLAAWAWRACARLISCPSGVTAAFVDIFWGLKGAQDKPRRVRARRRAAAIRDLPALDCVACSMRVIFFCFILILFLLFSF